MISRSFISKVITILFYVTCICYAEDNKRVYSLNNLYMDQEPPGNDPKIFSPGIISIDSAHEFSITLSPSGNEIFFSRRYNNIEGNRIYYMKYEDGKWTSPQLSPFSDGNKEMEPNFTPDGKNIIFNSWRPVPDSTKITHAMNVWFAQFENMKWKIGGILGPPISDLKPMFVTQTREGTIYFTGNVNRGIYRAKYEAGKYQNWERLPDQINSLNAAGHPFVEPDEKYIIFDSNVDSLYNKNLFISFKLESNSWSKPVNINKYIGFSHTAGIPHVSPDGKFLFFSSKGNIYWVSTSFIEDIKP